MIFEVGKYYENRRGKYQVLAIQDNQLQAKYANGETIWLSVDMQSRIYANIQNEKAPQHSHKPSDNINKTNSFYKLLGFLAAKDVHLLAFIPQKAIESFKDKWFDATNSELLKEQRGIIIHPPGTDKRWYECRMTFRASPQEIKELELYLPQATVVKADDTNGWNINNNKLFFALLEYDFQAGGKQSMEVIQASIPNMYLDNFNQGVTNAKGDNK